MSPAPRPRGFTLLEVLVAFALLAGSVGLLLAIVSGGMRQVRLSAETSEAAQWAQSLLAPLGVVEPIVEGEFDGRAEDGRYRWRLRIAEVGVEEVDALFPPPDALGGDDREDGDDGGRALDEPDLISFDDPSALVVYRIDLEVAWGESGEAARTARYSTLRLRAREVL